MLITQFEISDADWPAVRDSSPLWTAGYHGSIAIDPEQNIYLESFKTNSGRSYVLWRDRYGERHKRHSFKARSVDEAVEHVKQFLEKSWKD